MDLGIFENNKKNAQEKRKNFEQQLALIFITDYQSIKHLLSPKFKVSDNLGDEGIKKLFVEIEKRIKKNLPINQAVLSSDEELTNVVNEILNASITIPESTSFEEIINEIISLKQIIFFCDLLSNQLGVELTSTNINETLETLNEKISKISTNVTSEDIFHSSEDISQEYKTKTIPEIISGEMDKNIQHFLSYPKIDGIFNGISPAEIFVIAGMPGIGKTTFALTLLIDVCKEFKKYNEEKKEDDPKKCCLFIEMEMTYQDIHKKIVTSHTQTVIKNEEKSLKTKTDDDLENHKNFIFSKIDDSILPYEITTKTLTVKEIEKKIKSAKAEGKIYPVIFIDYLDVLGTEKDAEKEQ